MGGGRSSGFANKNIGALVDSNINLGKKFRCTNVNDCDSSWINVYCVDANKINADFNDYCLKAPFCIDDIFDTLLDVTCKPYVAERQELFCCVYNNIPLSGDWKWILYYEGVKISTYVDYVYKGDSYVQWYGYHPTEIWYNGTYTYEIEDPDGVIRESFTFMVTGVQEYEEEYKEEYEEKVELSAVTVGVIAVGIGVLGFLLLR